MRYYKSSIILLLLAYFFLGFANAASNDALAKKYQKAKDYDRSLHYRLKSLEEHPDSNWRAGMVGQNYFMYHRNIFEGMKYYRKAENLGFKTKWFLYQYMKASIWTGFHYMGEKNWEKAVYHFKKADDLNIQNNFKRTYTKILYDLAVKRQQLGEIKPAYNHKIKVLFIEKTNEIKKAPFSPVKSQLTQKQKNLTLLSVKGTISFWEAMSDGQLSADLKILEWEGPLTSLKIHRRKQHTAKRTRWIIDSEKLSLEMGDLIDSTVNNTDTYLIIWAAGRYNIASGGSGLFVTKDGKKNRRGIAEITAKRIVDDGYYLVFHEMFHVLEHIAKIKPPHGFKAENRHLFPNWKGNDQTDYFHWHFRNTLAKLPKGWQSVTFINEK